MSVSFPTFNDAVTPSQAARILGYSEQYVLRMLRNGKIDGIRWSGRWVLSRRIVERYKTSFVGFSKHDPRRRLK